MTPLSDHLRELNSAIGLHLDEHQLDNLFLGYMSQQKQLGYLFRNLTKGRELVPYLLDLRRSGRTQLYFDDYGKLIGHLLWTVANEANREAVLSLELPRVESSISQDGDLCILSIASLDGALSLIKKDVITLVSHFGRNLFYVRRKRQQVVAFGIHPHNGAKRLWHSEHKPMERIEDGLELPPVQLVARMRLREGELLRLYSEVNGFSQEVDHTQRIWRPIVLNQFGIARDERNRPSDAVTWAWIDQARFDEFVANPFDKHISHWRSGERLVVVDAVGDYRRALANAIDKGLLEPDDLTNAPILNRVSRTSLLKAVV